MTLRSTDDDTPIAGDALHLLSRVLDAVHQGGVRLHGEVVAHQGKAKALIQDRLDTLGYTFFDGTGNLRKLFRMDDVRSTCHEILSKIDARLDVHKAAAFRRLFRLCLLLRARCCHAAHSFSH